MMSSFFHALSALVSRSDILPNKGEDELSYLKSWLHREYRTPIAEPLSVEVDRGRINEIIRECTRCSGAGEKKTSFGRGSNGVMILLHLPEKVSSHEMKQYRTQAHDMLRKMLESTSIIMDECYVTNLVKCDSGTMHLPSRMFSSCSDILRAEIDEVTPKIIIVMGSFGPVAKMAKEYSLVQWFNIEHPVTLIKNPEMKRAAWETLKLVRARLDA
jgi:uracil-DNA glycosylase family 4